MEKQKKVAPKRGQLYSTLYSEEEYFILDELLLQDIRQRMHRNLRTRQD